MIAAAPGTAHTPRAHITNMAGLGKNVSITDPAGVTLQPSSMPFVNTDNTTTNNTQNAYGTSGSRTPASIWPPRTAIWPIRAGATP